MTKIEDGNDELVYKMGEKKHNKKFEVGS